jgi:hypothetical protein
MKKFGSTGLMRVVCVMVVGLVVLRVATVPRLHAAPQQQTNNVAIDSDDIGGVVTSANGPEGGVWVIAETNDFKTQFRKIVVTNDRGQYVLPDLPKATYKIWVRGYGLVDSQPVAAKPGKNLDLTAVIAPTAQAAAQYYPADYWYSMVKMPSRSDFPMNVPGEGSLRELGTGRTIQTQAAWIWSMRRGCGVCHQMGSKATRELEPELGSFQTTEQAWERKLILGQGGRQLHGEAGLGLSNPIAQAMWVDWVDRIAKGATPPVPERPKGVERSLVLSIWDFGTRSAFPHDLISTDKRYPTINPNGRLYVYDWGEGAVSIIDPVENSDYMARIPVRKEEWLKMWPSAEPDVDAEIPSPFWGKELKRVRLDPVNAGPGMMDTKGRSWFTVNTRIDVPPFCLEGNKNNKFVRYAPMKPAPVEVIRNRAAGAVYYDPKSEQFTLIDTCTGAAHVAFGYDKDETFYMAARGIMGISWINTRVWDQTHDVEKSQGWCPAVIDFNGDGKITKPWTTADEPPDPKLDRLAVSHTGYIISVNPVDGSIWYHTTDQIPGSIVRVDVGKNPPESCIAEMYQPPFDNATQLAHGPQGIDIDSRGIVWVSLTGSGHLASFDRNKCKIRNGPKTDGQHCPEGWTLYPITGPKFQGTDLTADYAYNDWVDRFNTLGLGNDLPMTSGTGSDSIKVLNPATREWVTLRVPYPMGFYTRSLDGRIDDPKGGWKGRGMWSAVASRVVWHTEGGFGTRPYAVHFQMRPDPLAK